MNSTSTTATKETASAGRRLVRAKRHLTTGLSPVAAQISRVVIHRCSGVRPWRTRAPSAWCAPSVAFSCMVGLVTVSPATSARCSCRSEISRAPCVDAGSSASCATSMPDPGVVFRCGALARRLAGASKSSTCVQHAAEACEKCATPTFWPGAPFMVISPLHTCLLIAFSHRFLSTLGKLSHCKMQLGS